VYSWLSSGGLSTLLIPKSRAFIAVPFLETRQRPTAIKAVGRQRIIRLGS